MTPPHNEKKLADAHGIKAEQVTKAFEKMLPRAKRDWKMMLEFTTKFSIAEDQRLAHLKKIQEYDRKGLLPEEILAEDSHPQDERPRTFSDDWEIWIRNQFAVKVSQCTSISEVGGMMLVDPSSGFRRSLWNDNVFIRGIRGGITGICKGDPGTGKTMFVCQEMIEPLSHVKNMQIVSNIAIKSFSGKKAPENVHYASTIPKSLRLAIQHALKGIRYITEIEEQIAEAIMNYDNPGKLEAELEKRKKEIKKYPYLTAWFVDEAGISKDKHDAMSDEWKTQRHITMISRKLKIFQMTIYQFDDAPDDIVRLSHLLFEKPDLFSLDHVTFSIRHICPEITLTGVLDDVKRKEYGMPYVEYDTDDTSGMSADAFDTQAMLQYINSIAVDGGIGSEAQFKRALEYIDIVENKALTISTHDGDMYFLYRQKKYYEAESDRLKAESEGAKTKSRKGDLLTEAKVFKSFTRWPFLCRLAKARYPERNWYTETLKREFDKLEKKYPDIADMPTPDPLELPDKTKEFDEVEVYPSSRIADRPENLADV